MHLNLESHQFPPPFFLWQEAMCPPPFLSFFTNYADGRFSGTNVLVIDSFDFLFSLLVSFFFLAFFGYVFFFG